MNKYQFQRREPFQTAKNNLAEGCENKALGGWKACGMENASPSSSNSIKSIELNGNEKFGGNSSYG